jgi:glutamate/tyrosine decarboxylase-like PLP-dependent enzyme
MTNEQLGRSGLTKEMLDDVMLRIGSHYSGLENRPVAPTDAAIDGLSEFDERLPLHGVGIEATIEMLDRVGSPATVATAGPRYFGFVIGGTFPVSVASNWLSTAWDQCSGSIAMSPVAAKVEAISAAWVCDLLGVPSSSAVGFVTGSTAAHVASLLAARRNRYARIGWDVDRRGLAGAPPLAIVATADMHASVVKALGMVGFGRDNVVRVPVDDQGRMDVSQIPIIDDSTIVICQAGNVNSGAFDAIEKIADLVESSGAWLHVDGAFGALARASARYQHLAAGLERADSVSCSAHKLFNVPYDSAIAICRHAADMEGALSVETSYAVKSGGREPNHFTLEGSRRARGIDIWAVLKCLGKQGFAAHVDSCCANAQKFASILSAGGLPILNEVVFNQVLIDFGDMDRRDRLLRTIQADGTCWLGPSLWRGKPVCRASFSNWSTSLEDVEQSARAILRIDSENG